MKQFVKALPVTGNCFNYIYRVFASLVITKLKASTFYISQARKLIRDEYCVQSMIETMPVARLEYVGEHVIRSKATKLLQHAFLHSFQRLCFLRRPFLHCRYIFSNPLLKRNSCNGNFCFLLVRFSVRYAETLNSGIGRWPAMKKMWKKMLLPPLVNTFEDYVIFVFRLG